MARNPNRTHTLTSYVTFRPGQQGPHLDVECHNDPDDPERDCRYVDMAGQPASGCGAKAYMIDMGVDMVEVELPTGEVLVSLPATARVEWFEGGEALRLVVEA